MSQSRARRERRVRDREARRAARHDQYTAAAAESIGWFRDVATLGILTGAYRDVGTGDPGDEFGRRLLAALNRRAQRFCSHVDRIAPRPLFVSLSHGAVVCRPCSRALRHEPIDDDGRCDVCDVEPPDGQFREIVLSGEFQIGPAIVFGNACDDCWSLCSPETARQAA